jgi:hypothetical protein
MRGEAMNDDFSEVFLRHTGKLADKWSSYLPIYDRVLSEYRHSPIDLLEIGIQNGGSLEVWSEYFTSARIVVGCDIDENCRKLKFTDPRIKIVVGSITEEATLAEIKAMRGEYDIIIDDGSHMSEDVILAFVKLFPLLKDDGIYIVEDLHTSYWHGHGGKLKGKNSSTEFFKRLVDVVNFEHWEDSISASHYLQGALPDSIKMPAVDLLTQVHQVSFYNSICVIHKKSSHHNSLGIRKVIGSEEPVTINAKALRDQQLTPDVRPAAPSVTYRVRSRISRMLGRS